MEADISGTGLHKVRWQALSACMVGTTGLPFEPLMAAPVQANAPVSQAENPVDPNAEAARSSTQAVKIGDDVDLRLTEQGQGMYKACCQKCRGLQRVTPGGGFVDLRTFPLDDRARFVDSVANGTRAMPAWGAVPEAGEIEAVWAQGANDLSGRGAQAEAAAGN